MLLPDFYFSRAVNIPLSLLQARGICGVVLDIDNTLAADGQPEPAEGVAAWLLRLHSGGIRAVVVSNNSAGRAKAFAERLDLPFVGKALKPSQRSVAKVLQELGCEARQVAVVGDQLFTDIAYGKRAGFQTILVEPFSRDLPRFVRFKRVLERPFKRRIRKLRALDNEQE